jgi:hypothetical protein
MTAFTELKRDVLYDARFLFGDDMPRSRKSREQFHTGRLLAFLFSISSNPDELNQTDYIGRGDLLCVARRNMQLVEAYGLSRALARLRTYDAAIISESRMLREHQRRLAGATHRKAPIGAA